MHILSVFFVAATYHGINPLDDLHLFSVGIHNFLVIVLKRGSQNLLGCLLLLLLSLCSQNIYNGVVGVGFVLDIPLKLDIEQIKDGLQSELVGGEDPVVLLDVGGQTLFLLKAKFASGQATFAAPYQNVLLFAEAAGCGIKILIILMASLAFVVFSIFFSIFLDIEYLKLDLIDISWGGLVKPTC